MPVEGALSPNNCMIPFAYRLRKEVRFEGRDGSFLVISDTPLNMVRVSERGAAILRSCDGRRSIAQIADEVTIPDRGTDLRDLRYFNKKGVLEPVSRRMRATILP